MPETRRAFSISTLDKLETLNNIDNYAIMFGETLHEAPCMITCRSVVQVFATSRLRMMLCKRSSAGGSIRIDILCIICVSVFSHVFSTSAIFILSVDK